MSKSSYFYLYKYLYLPFNNLHELLFLLEASHVTFNSTFVKRIDCYKNLSLYAFKCLNDKMFTEGC